MDSDKNVTATFAINTFPVTVAVSPLGSGSVARSPDLPQYPFGSTVQLTAAPAFGYHFVNWSGDAAGTTNPVSVTVNGAKNVTAVFALNAYTLTITKVGGGSVSKVPNQATYTHGMQVTLTANATGQYRFFGYSGDTSSTANPFVIVMTRNMSITATFVETAPPTVTVIAPNGGENFLLGASVPISWSASDNVAVTSVDVLLSRAGPSGPYETLALGVANSGSLSWTAVGLPSTNAYLLVKAYDAAGNVGSDQSDAAFNIQINPLAVDEGPIADWSLGRISPNPVANAAWLRYAVPREGRVSLSVVDLEGREIAELVRGIVAAGRYEVRWDGTRLPAGVYFVRFQGGGKNLVRRLVLTH